MTHIFGIATILLSTLYAGASCAAAGELWLRSATMMMGYYGDLDQSAAALRPGGWLATGDLARVLEDGSMAIIGRCKEMIIRSGFNVYPAEVCPTRIVILDALPAGPTGKIWRARLAQMAAQP